MKEVISFTLGVIAALVFMKATAMVVKIGSQSLICYALSNPLN